MRCVVEGGTWVRSINFDTTVDWLFWNEAALCNGWLGSEHVIDRLSYVVFTWTRNNIDRFERSDGKAEPINVAISVNFATTRNLRFQSGLEVLSKSGLIEVSSHLVARWLRSFIFLIFRRCMRIIKINRHNLLGNRINELMSHLVNLLLLVIKVTIVRVILTWTWLSFTLTLHAFGYDSTLGVGIEFRFCTRLILLHKLWIVLTNRWVSLLEIDVNRDGFHII